ncbi:MAG: hypothetical protein CMJ18_14565 [Phycisphaeraceae bacterium]|nr:hypothetical protein [Phycisphaeraceae bacterium]
MKRNHLRHDGRRGFTLVELLVALGLTTLMLFIIGQAFFDSSEAVRHGIRVSGIIGEARTVGDQLDTDARDMLGPGDNGVLVILYHLIQDVPVLERTAGTTHSDLRVRDNIRSDQLTFFARDTGSGMESICPYLPPSAAGASTYASAPERYSTARIWYGHVLPMKQPSSIGNALGAAGNNEIGTNWILGRQALLLSGGGPLVADQVVVDGVTVDSDVVGYAGFKVFHGYADVSNRMFNEVTGTDTTIAPFPLLGADLTNDQYKTAAYRLTFGTTRLWVDAEPAGDGGAQGAMLYPQRVAQTHGIFGLNVSDFIVEFAADAIDDNDDDVPDGTPDVDNTNNIRWYSGSNVPVWDVGTYLHDPNDAAGLTHGSAGFVWRHDYPDNWPYLIRIRYRIHDPLGLLRSSTDGESGRWFEQIFQVNRS